MFWRSLAVAEEPSLPGAGGTPEVEKNLVYARPGDEPLGADLYHPPGLGPFPGILMVHGGAWMSGDKIDMAWHAQRLAAQGFLVLSINYRLAPRHRFPAQVEDCQTALRWWRARAMQDQLDVHRVGAYGYSAGGHLVCLLGALGGCPFPPISTTTQEVARVEAKSADSNVVDPALRLKAIVAGGAPCDFQQVAPQSERFVFWLGGTRADRPEVYAAASPVNQLRPGAPPMLLFHGDADWLVPQRNSERFLQTLRQQGIPAEWHVVPHKGHLGAFLDRDAFQRAAQFLSLHLAEGPHAVEQRTGGSGDLHDEP